MLLLNIHHEKFDAVVSSRGAQILSWKPKNQDDVFWSCDEKFYKNSNAIRAGVPICWPWFGTKNGISHGFARNAIWNLDKYEEFEEFVLIIFTLNPSEHSNEFAHDFKATMTLTIGQKCLIEFEALTHNETQIALHSYFRVGDIENIEINGLGASCYDKLQDNKYISNIPTKIVVNNAVDRIFDNPKNSISIVDKSFGREINIKHFGATDAILWNPWSDGVKKIKDMHAGDYQKMVCVENGCVTKNFGGKIAVEISIV